MKKAPAPVAERFAYNWTGFYIGVHGCIGGGTFKHAFDHPAGPLDKVAIAASLKTLRPLAHSAACRSATTASLIPIGLLPSKRIFQHRNQGKRLPELQPDRSR